MNNNLLVSNIDKFKTVKPFSIDWEFMMKKKIIECIINAKYSDVHFYNNPVKMEHGVTHLNNRTLRALEGINMCWMSDPHTLNKNEMLINVISE